MSGVRRQRDDGRERAGLGDLLDDVLSVESVGVFKPARAVYDMVGTRFGTEPSEVLFVSSNGWDAAGAESRNQRLPRRPASGQGSV